VLLSAQRAKIGHVKVEVQDGVYKTADRAQGLLSLDYQGSRLGSRRWKRDEQLEYQLHLQAQIFTGPVYN
jgi:hypothetical protein